MIEMRADAPGGLQPPRRTFFDAPRGNLNDVVPGSLAFVGMPSDWTHTSRIGTRFGPRALRQETSVIAHQLAAPEFSEVIEADTGRLLIRRERPALLDLGDALIVPSDPAATTRAIADMTAGIVANGGLPVSVGGDHYNSYPACLGVSEAMARGSTAARFGFIQIDGHLDFVESHAVWGRMNHATNARRVSELSNVVRANMVWIGIAGWVDGHDVADIEGFGGTIFSAADVHRLGAAEVMRRAVAQALRGCDGLYLSIDIDAMDAGFLPGTGSIVHSGITPRQYQQMLRTLSDAPLVGIDLVEVSPPLDPSGRSERMAASLLFDLLKPAFYVPVGDQTAQPLRQIS